MMISAAADDLGAGCRPQVHGVDDARAAHKSKRDR
jgi:hypothetical protein